MRDNKKSKQQVNYMGALKQFESYVVDLYAILVISSRKMMRTTALRSSSGTGICNLSDE
jgi:hypothetical protein